LKLTCRIVSGRILQAPIIKVKAFCWLKSNIFLIGAALQMREIGIVRQA
jgi:hypothetical protein